MRAKEFIIEKWTQKYKKSINCSHPKGFSQKAHCAGKKKHNESVEMEMTCEDCGMCETHGNLSEIKNGLKDSNGFTKCWPGKHAEEDYDPNDTPPGPEFKPTMPAGTVRVDVSDVYDWYKLGQHISNLKGLGKHDFGKGPPSTILSFGSEEEEHKYIDALKKTGLSTTDIDPIDPKQPKGMRRQKTDPAYNVGENFADGRNPQDKGDSARHGIKKGSSISALKKIRSSDTASSRKKQLAHWQINMKQGRKKGE